MLENGAHLFSIHKKFDPSKYLTSYKYFGFHIKFQLMVALSIYLSQNILVPFSKKTIKILIVILHSSPLHLQANILMEIIYVYYCYFLVFQKNKLKIVAIPNLCIS